MTQAGPWWYAESHLRWWSVWRGMRQSPALSVTVCVLGMRVAVETSLAHAQHARRAETIHSPGTPHRGKIEVSTQAIAAVAGRATMECYGVVGIAARHPRFTTLELLTPSSIGAALTCALLKTMSRSRFRWSLSTVCVSPRLPAT